MRDIKRYIGVCDFRNGNEAREMLEVFGKEQKPGSDRRLMVGTMMSRKTLNDLPTKWKGIFPAKETLKDVFTDHPLALNTLHYADYYGIDTAENLTAARSWCGPHLHAIQLDMVWPKLDEIKRFWRGNVDTKIILQIGRKSFEMAEENPKLLCSMIRSYQGFVNGVVLDKSGGEGKALDGDFMKPFVAEIAERLPRIGIGVAGALAPDTLHLLEPLRDYFEILSIDMNMRVEMKATADYIRRAILMLG